MKLNRFGRLIRIRNEAFTPSRKSAFFLAMNFHLMMLHEPLLEVAGEKYLRVIQVAAPFTKMPTKAYLAQALNPTYLSSLKRNPIFLITSLAQAIPYGLSALVMLKKLSRGFGRTHFLVMSSSNTILIAPSFLQKNYFLMSMNFSAPLNRTHD